ncbi:DsrE family protein [Massilia sp. W12]|uniref:DsrE family protein n=1 Tax=Massilia sp. W12 TaxID=3126507 RepID=UPI0030CE2FD0
MRRQFIGALALSALTPLALAQQTTAASAPTVRVVYHVADGIEQAQRALGNMRNHLLAEPGHKLVLVALSGGIDFLLEGARDTYGNPFDARIAWLAQQGVEFKVCNNTLRNMKLDPSKLVLEAKLVTSGVAEIARLQAREQYVYIRP